LPWGRTIPSCRFCRATSSVRSTKYGQDLQPNQLIKIDGKIMAVAFMGDGQQLFYRKDILEKAGAAELL
jgi:hypothetical protein